MFTAVLQGMTLAVVAAVGPNGSQIDGPSKRFDLLGIQICIGDPGDGQPCHVRMYPPTPAEDGEPAPDTEAEPVPLELSLFGKRLCLGAVPSQVACDVRLAAADEPDDRVGA